MAVRWISTSVSGLLQLPVLSVVILDLGLRVTSVYLYRRIYMNGLDRIAAPGDYLSIRAPVARHIFDLAMLQIHLLITFKRITHVRFPVPPLALVTTSARSVWHWTGDAPAGTVWSAN